MCRNCIEKDGDTQSSRDTQTEGEGEQAKGDHDGGLEKGEKESAESEKEKDSATPRCWSQNRLKALYRKFNLDLAPKVNKCYFPCLFFFIKVRFSCN